MAQCSGEAIASNGVRDHAAEREPHPDNARRKPARPAELTSLETTVAVINAGNARSFVSEQRFPNHIVPRTFDGRSRTANLAKDVGLAAELARQAGRPGAYSALAARLLARAIEQGLGDEDFTRLYDHLDRLMSPDAEPA